MKRAIIFMVLMLVMILTAKEVEYKPFILAFQESGNIDSIALKTKAKLMEAGFEISGEYSPYAKSKIIIITNDVLKGLAGKTKYGGFGAAQRVSLTELNGSVQVSYTNPVYMFHAYQMMGNIKPVYENLKKALGFIKEYGPDDGLEAEDIEDYHYKIMMPYFDDFLELEEYDTYEQAISMVEKGLKAKAGGTSKIYRIDIPGKKVSVFGVSLSVGEGSDKFVMEEIDFKKTRSTAHLPYEMMVIGNEVIALHAKFRIAINFPDLSMMGSHSFMGIMGAPGDIEDALEMVARGGKK
ncbi:MAG: hypothetical protein PF574_00560 [Candidatus Delongbacteria bacterium]|jgi:hypothetical protein|nr:hypothetical protein [Candidatus Delongbacteria bacterium]